MIVHTKGWSAARAAHYNIVFLTKLYEVLNKGFLIQKINKAAFGKNQQIGLKVLIF